MKCKNIFFVLCGSMMFVSATCAMQLMARRVPKSMSYIKIMSPMVQKRNFSLDPDLAAVIYIVGGIAIINFIGETLAAGSPSQRKAEKEFILSCMKHQKIDQKIVKEYQKPLQKIPEFIIKVSDVKLLTEGSEQQLNVKKNKQEDKANE